MSGEVRRQVQDAVLRLYLAGYRTAAWIVGCYYLILIPEHFMAQSSAVGRQMILANLATASFLLGSWGGIRARIIQARHWPWVAFTCLLTILANHLALVAYTGRLDLTSDFMLILVAASVISPRTRWYAGSMACYLSLWALWIWIVRPVGDSTHWYVGVLSASIISLVLHGIVSRLSWMQARLRVRDKLLARRQRRYAKALEEALANVQMLSGLIPICGNCKKVRDDGGYWQRVEHYFEQRSEVAFTHGLCPECEADLRQQFEDLVPPWPREDKTLPSVGSEAPQTPRA